MNNTFNFNRFNKVVAYDWKRYLRNFGITLLVWISLPIMFWVTTLIFDFELPVEARESIIFALVASPSCRHRRVSMAKSTCRVKVWASP